MYDFLLYGLLAPYDSPDQMQTLKMANYKEGCLCIMFF